MDGEQLEKTRAQTAAAKEEPTPPKVKRATTIAQTTEVLVHQFVYMCVLKLLICCLANFAK